MDQHLLSLWTALARWIADVLKHANILGRFGFFFFLLIKIDLLQHTTTN